MSSGVDRRWLLTGGLSLFALRRAAAAAPAPAGEGAPRAAAKAPDLERAGEWARRALAALERPARGFVGGAGAAVCDLGAAGRLELTRVGEGAVRVTLVGRQGELEILRAIDSPRVARVEARWAAPAAPPVGPCYDTLRRTPGGYELTFSSALALRHTPARPVVGEPPVVYESLAETALRDARPFLG